MLQFIGHETDAWYTELLLFFFALTLVVSVAPKQQVKLSYNRVAFAKGRSGTLYPVWS